jgi:hypothetical protein
MNKFIIIIILLLLISHAGPLVVLLDRKSRKCAVLDCQNRKGDADRSFFAFPKEDER